MTELEGVAQEILKQLKYYERNVSEKVDAAKEENAKACLKAIKMKSPKGKPMAIMQKDGGSNAHQKD